MFENSRTSLLSFHWSISALYPLQQEKWEILKDYLCVLSRQKVIHNIHTWPTGYCKRFAAQCLNCLGWKYSLNQVCFDWWSQSLTRLSFVTHISLLTQYRWPKHRGQKVYQGSGTAFLAAFMSVSITLCRLLPYSTNSIIKVNHIHSRYVAACYLTMNVMGYKSQSLMIFLDPFAVSF